MKRWLTFLAFLLCIASSVYAMGIGLDSGIYSLMAAAYAGGIAAFFAFIFIRLPTINSQLAKGNNIILMALLPTGIELLVMLVVPFIFLGMSDLTFADALSSVLIVDTATLAMPFALLSSLRAGVAQTLPTYVITLGICAVLLPILYLILLLWEHHNHKTD